MLIIMKEKCIFIHVFRLESYTGGGVNIQPNVTTCLNDQSKLAQYGEQRRLNEVEC